MEPSVVGSLVMRKRLLMCHLECAGPLVPRAWRPGGGSGGRQGEPDGWNEHVQMHREDRRQGSG